MSNSPISPTEKPVSNPAPTPQQQTQGTPKPQPQPSTDKPGQQQQK